MKSRILQLRTYVIFEKDFIEGQLYCCVKAAGNDEWLTGYAFKKSGVIFGFLNGIFYDNGYSVLFKTYYSFKPYNNSIILTGKNYNNNEPRQETFN